MLITRTNPTGSAHYIAQAQKLLHRELVKLWGEEVKYDCYGLSFRNKSGDGFIAEMYAGEKEYKEVYFDDSLDAISFFGISDKVTRFLGANSQADVHLVFFVNLARLKPEIKDRADELVRAEVQKVLGKNSYGLTYTSTETGVQNCLREYPGSRRDERLKHFDMQPYHCFRLNYKLTFNPYAGLETKGFKVKPNGTGTTGADATGPFYTATIAGSGNLQFVTDADVTADFGSGPELVKAPGIDHYITNLATVKVYHHDTPKAVGFNSNYVTISEIAGDLPAALERFTVRAKLTSLPVLPATVKHIGLASNNLSTATLNSLVASLDAGGQENGTLDYRYQYTGETATDQSAINSLLSKGWQIE